MKNLNSIRARMTLAFAATIAVLTLSTCLLLNAYARRAAERNIQSILQNAVRKVRQELSGAAPLQNVPELREMESDLRDEHLALVLLDARGHVVESSSDAPSLLSALRTPPAQRNIRGEWRTQTFSLGIYTAVIGFPWAQTQRALDNQAQVLLVFSGIMGCVATCGAWLLVGRTLSPIGGLSQQARAATAEGGTVRLSPSSADAEVVELVDTLNGLLARQEQANAARGRFYAAASHELRTPLQALSGHLELALQRPRAREEYLAVVEEAHAQTQRLTSLVRDLLRLHQLEADPRPSPEIVDLASICSRAQQSLQKTADSRELTVQMEMQSPVFVASAPSHADMIARNLLENALLYAPPRSLVRLILTEQAGSALLEIWNEVDLLQQNTARERLPGKWLEAFYRPDSSRTGRTGGNGLGLAICKAVADANGWQLSLLQEDAHIAARIVFTKTRAALSHDPFSVPKTSI